MARTPSLSAAEAEAQLGPRGTIRVDSNNRAIVRKWLTAQGLPSLFVGALSMTELGVAYNDTNGHGLDKVRAKLAETLANDPDALRGEDESPVIANGVDANGTAIHIAPALGDGTTIEQAIRAIAASVVPKTQSIDETAVRTIVKNELAGSPTLRIEVKGADSVVRLVEGTAHKMLPSVIEIIAQNIPALLIGPAGAGKSTAAEQVAHALGVAFYIQGAATGTHEYLGYKDGYGNYHATPFRQAFEHGGLFCAEELDSGSADVPLILNAGLANGHMAFPDSVTPIKRHADFRIIANANTYGNGADRVYVGRTQLDGATIDRFAFVTWDYDTVLERALTSNDAWVDRVQSLRRAAQAEKARLIVSPRASINGAKMLAAGWTMAACEESFIWKGTDSELRKRIEGRAH